MVPNTVGMFLPVLLAARLIDRVKAIVRPHNDFEACVEVVTGVNFNSEGGIATFMMDEVKSVDPHIACEIDGLEVNEEVGAVAGVS